MSLPRCEVNKSYWTQYYKNCVNGNLGRKSAEDCCAELDCSNPEIISNVCKAQDNGGGGNPHFGDRRMQDDGGGGNPHFGDRMRRNPEGIGVLESYSFPRLPQKMWGIY